MIILSPGFDAEITFHLPIFPHFLLKIRFDQREAAVGAQPGVVLDAAVEEFYQGPEIGLIRVKEVGALGDLNFGHGKLRQNGGIWVFSPDFLGGLKRER